VRLIAAAAIAALVLLAACGDDDSPSTSTPSSSPTEAAVAPGQLTPNSNACTREIVEGTLVSTDSAGDATLITLEVQNTDVECVFDGPPELRWYDADANALGIPFTPGPACESDATEYDDCIYQDPIGLFNKRDFSVPIGTPYEVRAIVSVTKVDALIPCASPTKQAHTIGLQFPGVSLDVQIDVEDPVEMQFCSAQVDLVGYGPVRTGSD
jgi:hypothetical protein